MWETLSPPLLENGCADLDDIWTRAAYLIGLSDGETILDLPVTVPRNARRTDKLLTGHRQYRLIFASHESAKSYFYFRICPSPVFGFGSRQLTSAYVIKCCVLGQPVDPTAVGFVGETGPDDKQMFLVAFFKTTAASSSTKRSRRSAVTSSSGRQRGTARADMYADDPNTHWQHQGRFTSQHSAPIVSTAVHGRVH